MTEEQIKFKKKLITNGVDDTGFIYDYIFGSEYIFKLFQLVFAAGEKSGLSQTRLPLSIQEALNSGDGIYRP